MKCNKCKKEIDEQFVFCPYCGTKVANKFKPNFTNAEFLSICNMEQFEKEYETLISMPKEDAFYWLKDMHEGIAVYAIYADWCIEYSYQGQLKTWNYCDVVSEEMAVNIVKGIVKDEQPKAGIYVTPKVTKYYFRIEEKTLNKTMAKNLGTIWFFNRKDVGKSMNVIEAEHEKIHGKSEYETESNKKEEQTDQNLLTDKDLILMPTELLEKLQRKENENG